ncbi:AAA family ATPase [Hamadaea sp. NPDC050747]|uniref:chloramphenicol phosphotransferase CPT family protein n=1 Tax=Hamadaea sp. NPDC050747 TaxID=3155789 RepID=UPI0033F3F8E3
MEPPRTGQIILLNGTSSAGKTSIARELLPLLDRPYYFMPVDALNSMRHQRPMSPDELEATLQRLAAGYHRAAAGMAEGGNDVVLDHVLRRPEWLRECVELFPADVVFVKVHCPLPELQRREAARGDRPIGKAESQYPLVHRDAVYDVEVDTSELSPRDCAERIKSFVDAPSGERAFARLAARWAAASPPALA